MYSVLSGIYIFQLLELEEEKMNKNLLCRSSV